MKVVSAREMQRIDRQSIASGIKSSDLMENAGKKVFESLKALYGARLRKKRILLVAGKGNNAGDGFVVVRYLQRLGVKVMVCLAGSKNKLKGDTLTNYKKIERRSVGFFKYAKATLRKELKSADIVLDGLFGTGLHSKLRSPYTHIIRAINASGKDVIAIDIPSGIDGDTGARMGCAVEADHTITFGLPKMGCVSRDGIDCCGELHVESIGFPKRFIQGAKSDVAAIDHKDIQKTIPRRKKSAHKGTGGHVLVIAGSPGKIGAASMTAESAFRTGSGLITLLTHPKSLRTVAAQIREVFLEGFPKTVSEFKAYLKNKNAVSIGPGLGFSFEAQNLLKWTIQYSRQPIVIDADGLTILAKHLSWLKKRRAPVILTPHPGEMGRLSKKTTQRIQNDRVGIARTFAKRHKVILVLKGARTVIASPSGKVWVNLTGHEAMATAGAGDVLTGMIASFLGQRMKPEDAAKAAVFMHGELGEVWAKKTHASRGLLSRDLIRLIPRTIEKNLTSSPRRRGSK